MPTLFPFLPVTAMVVPPHPFFVPSLPIFQTPPAFTHYQPCPYFSSRRDFLLSHASLCLVSVSYSTCLPDLLAQYPVCFVQFLLLLPSTHWSSQLAFFFLLTHHAYPPTLPIRCFDFSYMPPASFLDITLELSLLSSLVPGFLRSLAGLFPSALWLSSFALGFTLLTSFSGSPRRLIVLYHLGRVSVPCQLTSFDLAFFSLHWNERPF